MYCLPSAKAPDKVANQLLKSIYHRWGNPPFRAQSSLVHKGTFWFFWPYCLKKQGATSFEKPSPLKGPALK